MTGPALWQVADHKSQWFADTHPGTTFTRVEKVLLHSTEGTGWPSYQGGAVAPHFTVRPDFARERMVWRQHFPATRSARALRNPAGGVETNKDGVIQVEIVGTCDRVAARHWTGRFLRTWALEDWMVEGLAEFVRWCHVEHGVPLRAPADWPAYGSGRSARMSGHVFNKFRGVLGHLHVPENTHGDPGDIPIRRIIDAAEDDMTPEQMLKVLKSSEGRKAIAEAVLGSDSVPNGNGETPEGRLLTPRTVLSQLEADGDRLRAEVAGLRRDVAELVELLKHGPSPVSVTVTSPDPKATSEAVAETVRRLGGVG